MIENFFFVVVLLTLNLLLSIIINKMGQSMTTTMHSFTEFDSTPFPPARIAINDQLRDLWDFEEVQGFYTPIAALATIRVIQTNDPDADRVAAMVLGAIQSYIDNLKQRCVHLLRTNPLKCSRVRDNLIVFVVTKCTVQEIPFNRKFEGMNKPKDIVHNTGIDDLVFEKDNEYRAGRRHIMLCIRTPQNKLKSWKTLKRLLLHELSHTMCNHIVYRDAGNHGRDFKRCESFLKGLCSMPTNEEHYIEQLIQNVK